MQKQQSFLSIFLLFLALSFLIFFLSRIGFLGKVSLLSSPLFGVQGKIFQISQIPIALLGNKKLQLVQKENLELKSKIAKMQQLQQENIALRDQFQTTNIQPSTLLPATIIGDPQFIPGISKPEILTIDKGSKDDVTIGNSVVYKDSLVGIVSQVAENASQVNILTNKNVSFIARTSKNAQGVLKGQGNGEMTLGNVLLSDSLKVGDTIITEGSENLQTKGLPPGLVVGRIISVSKNPSSLYQSARVQSFLEIQKLTIVFIIVHSY